MYFIKKARERQGDIIEKEKKKMGRPTDNPKNNQTRIRMTDEEVSRLEYCSNVLGITKTEVINKGVEKIYQEIKENK